VCSYVKVRNYVQLLIMTIIMIACCIKKDAQKQMPQRGSFTCVERPLSTNVWKKEVTAMPILHVQVLRTVFPVSAIPDTLEGINLAKT
jgi:hypothetical protein